VLTETDIIIKDANSINFDPPNKATLLSLTAFTTDSVCREISVESEVSNEILTVAAVAGNTQTSIGRSISNKTIITENGDPITYQTWLSYSESEKNLIVQKSKLDRNKIENNLKTKYANTPQTILDLISKYNSYYNGIAGIPNQKFDSNQQKNQQGSFLDEFLEEPFPTSHFGYVMKIQEFYKFIFQGTRQAVLEGNNSGWNAIFNLRTATFPIKLKLKLDGIHGFKFGNYITTNWLPTGYSSKNCYFQIIKVSHTIANNDWYTELEAMYRIILPNTSK
jgi:hypothetical protein